MLHNTLKKQGRGDTRALSIYQYGQN